jgi:phage terminase large subunit-like protein
MGPATDRFYTLVANRQLVHDGDKRLAAHITNAVAKSTAAGDVITKDPRHGRKHKIDLGVAAIVAVDRAAWHLNNTPRTIGFLAV